MRGQANAREETRNARAAACGIAALAAVLAGCAGLMDAQRAQRIDQVSRSSESFTAFLQSPGKTIDEIQELMPGTRADSVFLIDENVTNEELGEYIQREARAIHSKFF